MQDGIHHLIPEAQKSAKKLRDTYNRKPGAPFFHKTFGLWMCLDHWYETGLDRSVDLTSFFLLDAPGHHELGQLGWCEAAFSPQFEEIVLKDLGDKEMVQDIAGRSVLYFKGRRHGFMPEYLDHPVKDRKTWGKNVKWRLNPKTPERYQLLKLRMDKAREAAAKGLMMQQNLIGGYMYLRSLFGPEHLLYAFYDKPGLVHDCMKSWYELADQVIAKHQQAVTLDELFMAEDICYNHGPLISPEMIQSFLFPYYQQLVENIKKRQLDKNRHLYIQIDTDGDAISVIDLYKDHIGMDVMSPFEVASGCDVRHVADHYPDLVISGGIDKRILSKGKTEIDDYLESILPVMRKRGGYIPTEDHGVPLEVSWQNFHYYRRRCVEFGE